MCAGSGRLFLSSRLLPGAPARDFELETLEGKRVALRELPGSVAAPIRVFMSRPCPNLPTVLSVCTGSVRKAAKRTHACAAES